MKGATSEAAGGSPGVNKWGSRQSSSRILVWEARGGGESSELCKGGVLLPGKKGPKKNFKTEPLVVATERPTQPEKVLSTGGHQFERRKTHVSPSLLGKGDANFN